MSNMNGQWFAGATLAATAVPVVAVGAWTLGMTARSFGAFEILHLGSAVAASFVAGVLCWRMTEGARTIPERWVYLTLSAVGMTFTIQAVPYMLWGVASWIVSAFVVHAVMFGVQAVVAVAIWALVLSLLNRSGVKAGTVWSEPSRGAVVWSIVGAIVVLIPLTVLGLLALG